MKVSFLKLYRCPRCMGELDVSQGAPSAAGDLREARLRCRGCGAGYEVRGGIVDLLAGGQALSEVKRREMAGWEKVSTPEGEPDLAREKEIWKQLPLVYVKELSENEAFDHWRQASMTFPAVLALMGPLTGRRVLDMGASVGWAARRFAALGAEVVALDMSEHFLKWAGLLLEEGIYFERLLADAEAMPLAGGRFDFVFCCATIHHSERPRRMLSEVARVLRPGGRFFAIGESCRPLLRSARRMLNRSAKVREHLSLGINEQIFSHRQYRGFIQGAGLRFSAVHPRWDVAEDGGGLRVERNAGLRRAGFTISGRERSGLRRWAHRLGVEKLLRNGLLASSAREWLFHFTESYRILEGEKSR